MLSYTNILVFSGKEWEALYAERLFVFPLATITADRPHVQTVATCHSHLYYKIAQNEANYTARV